MIKWRFLSLLCICTSALMLPVVGFADSSPKGRVLLTVSGLVGASEGPIEFDRNKLRALDWVEVETFTEWTEGKSRFAGPTLSSLLASVQAGGQQILAVALDDYTVLIPVEDAQKHNVFLAMEQYGKVMGVREKGPIWVIYPDLENDAHFRKTHNPKMIWQLSQLTVRP